MRTPMGCCGSTSKGTDLGVHSSEDLNWVAQELNSRWEVGLHRT